MNQHELVFTSIHDELHRAEKLQEPIRSFHEGYSVILEELDELWDSIKHNNEKQAATEARQVAAMAARFLLDLYHHTPKEKS